jgi:hypothetical protein
MLLAVVLAPLPVLFHVVSRNTSRPHVPASFAENLLVVVVLWMALQSSVVLLLGWTGHLQLGGMLVLEASLLVLGLWLVRPMPIVAGPAGWERRESLGLPSDLAATERTLVAAACGVALLLILRLLTLPVTDSDSVWFHLPRIAQWYQQATVATPIDALGDDIHNFYPYTWNALFFLVLAPVGHDQFVLMPSVLAWLALGLATYTLGRLVGSQRFGAMFAALLVLLLPASINDAQTAHSDLALAAFLVASVYFTLHGWRHRQRFSLLMAVICVAMMAGTTLFALAYVGLLAALWVCLFFVNRMTGKSQGDWIAIHSPLMKGLVVASVGLPAASWYLHNAVVTGNPLGVVQISFLGRVLLPGKVTLADLNKTTVLSSVSFFNPAHARVWLRAAAHSFALPGLVLAVLALVAPFRLLRRPQIRPLLGPVLCVCAASVFLYSATPWSANWGDQAKNLDGWFIEYALRYSFPFWGLVGAIAGVAIGASSPTAMAAWGMVGVATFGAIKANTDGWLSSKAGIVSAFAAAFVFIALHPSSQRLVRQGVQRFIARYGRKPTLTLGLGSIAAASVILISLATAALLRPRYSQEDVLWGGISRFMDELPAETRIGFWDTDQLYFFYGKHFQHRVSYMRLDDYATSDDMLRYLCGQPVDVIAVGPGNFYYELPRARAWIVKDPSHFERLHGKDPKYDVFVYRLNRSPVAEASSGRTGASVALSQQRSGTCASGSTRYGS